jgi:hypothetical protein
VLLYRKFRKEIGFALTANQKKWYALLGRGKRVSMRRNMTQKILRMLSPTPLRMKMMRTRGTKSRCY